MERGETECSALYTVDGMSCASCVAHVEKAMASVPGVDAVAVNLVAGQARITFRAEAAPDLRAVADAVNALGYEAALSQSLAPGARVDEARALLFRGLASLALGIALMAVMMGAVPMPAAQGAFWFVFAFAALASAALGWPVLNKGARTLAQLAPGMDALVMMGVLASWTQAALAHAMGGGHAAGAALEAAPMLLGFVLVGRSLEARARRRGADALAALAAHAAPRAVRIAPEGGEQEVETRVLDEGDTVLVRPGATVPCDGRVLSGGAEADESLLTGEALPVPKQPGDAVYAGTLVSGGALTVRVERVPGHSLLDGMLARLAAAQATKPPMVKLADRIAAVFVPAVMALAALTLAVHAVLLHRPLPEALGFAAAVLVAACPCAMGLAAPMAVTTALGTAARRGVLFADALALEKAAHVKVVVLDKTGTLTRGRPRLLEIIADPGMPEGNVLALAGSLEAGSEHPLGKALREAARGQGQPVLAVEGFKALPGRGVSGTVEGQAVTLGRLGFAGPNVRDPNGIAAKAMARAAETGATALFLSAGGRVLAALLFTDTLRPEAPAALGELKGLGMRLVLCTGDHEAAARAAARELEAAPGGAPLDEVRHGQTPQDKAELMASLAGRGVPAAMAGDGVNDAEALAQAWLGVAMGGGADVSKASADVVLPAGRIGALPWALSLGRRTLAVIRQNFAWAFAYNLAILPAAAGALPGVHIPAMWAALGMSFSSLAVAFNSLRLRRHP